MRDAFAKTAATVIAPLDVRSCLSTSADTRANREA
jgi:hypothetical protein